MEITLHEINLQNLKDTGKCNGAFKVDSKLILSAQNNGVHFETISTPPYQKTYPVEAIDYGTYIDHPDRTVFLAYMDLSVAGEIRLRWNWNNFAYIEDIVVDVSLRRRGVGRMLIKRAIQWAKEKQLPGVMLETQNNNVPACLLYQACGFELGGFDQRLYRGLHADSEEIALFWYMLFNLKVNN